MSTPGPANDDELFPPPQESAIPLRRRRDSRSTCSGAFSALLGPVFGSQLVQAAGDDDTTAPAHYRAGFKPLLYGIVLAIVLACFLRETGPAVRRTAVNP